MKTIRYKEFRFRCPLYPVAYSVVFTNDVKTYMFLKHGLDVATAGACTSHKLDGPVEVVFPENPPMEWMGHEACHLAQCILGLVGVKFSFDNQEPMAYLTGHVMAEVYKAYKDRKKGKWKTL